MPIADKPPTKELIQLDTKSVSLLDAKLLAKPNMHLITLIASKHADMNLEMNTQLCQLPLQRMPSKSEISLE
jgi:hypothetical protein